MYNLKRLSDDDRTITQTMRHRPARIQRSRVKNIVDKRRLTESVGQHAYIIHATTLLSLRQLDDD